MRIAVVADIHANLAAFEAVIAAWGEVDRVWCLGDVVGYGPEPNACIERLCQFSHICVPGNHDWAAIGRIDISDFNPAARAAAEWTAEQLTLEARRYLENLPERTILDPFTIVHGSPRFPIWEYLLDLEAARINFTQFTTPYCLIGHSHVPLMFTADGHGQVDGQALAPGEAIELGGLRRIINPGSVGQPRDGDPRASFGLIVQNDDELTFELRRVEYPIAETQRRMRRAGLPDVLAARLEVGR